MRAGSEGPLEPQQREQAERLCREWGIRVTAPLLEAIPFGPQTAAAIEQMAQAIARYAPAVLRMAPQSAIVVLAYLQERAIEYTIAQMVADGQVEVETSTGVPRLRLTERGWRQG